MNAPSQIAWLKPSRTSVEPSMLLLPLCTAALGAVAGFLLATTRQRPRKYGRFESVASIQKNLRTDASKATVKVESAKQLQKLRSDGLVGKRWPVQMRCSADGTAKSGGSAGLLLQPEDLEVRVEELHFVSMLELLGAARSHNSMADFCVSMHINRADTYNFPDNFDAPLTEVGRQQAAQLQSYAKTTTPQLVAVSPMSRALMTANIAYGHLIGKVPFIAHDGCKERCNGHACDFRRSKDQQKLDFPNVDFQHVAPEDPCLTPSPHGETWAEATQRGYDFMLWLRDRPESPGPLIRALAAAEPWKPEEGDGAANMPVQELLAVRRQRLLQCSHAEVAEELVWGFLEVCLLGGAGHKDGSLLEGAPLLRGLPAPEAEPTPLESFRRAVLETLAFLAVRKVAAGHDGQAIAALERAELACISCMAFAEAAAGRSTKAFELVRGVATLSVFFPNGPGDVSLFASVWKSRCRLGCRGALRALQGLQLCGAELAEALAPLAQQLDASEEPLEPPPEKPRHGHLCALLRPGGGRLRNWCADELQRAMSLGGLPEPEITFEELEPFLVAFRTEETRKEAALRCLDLLGAPTLGRHAQSSRYRQAFMEAFAPLSLHMRLEDDDQNRVPPHGTLPALPHRETTISHCALQCLAIWPRESLLQEVLVRSLRKLSADPMESRKLPRRVLRASEDPRLYLSYAEGLWASGAGFIAFHRLRADFGSHGPVLFRSWTRRLFRAEPTVEAMLSFLRRSRPELHGQHPLGCIRTRMQLTADKDIQVQVHYPGDTAAPPISEARLFEEVRTEELFKVTRALQAKNFSGQLGQVLQRADTERMILIGHSFGSASAWRFLRTAAQRNEAPGFQSALLMDLWPEVLLEADFEFTPQVPFALTVSGEWVGYPKIMAGNKRAAAHEKCQGCFHIKGTCHQWISETQMAMPNWLLRRMGAMGPGDWPSAYAATMVVVAAFLANHPVPSHDLVEPLANL
ncbi:unnamed protein product [Effrenium voratum]|nr:unnamed protein product [Effrenium voratum]